MRNSHFSYRSARIAGLLKIALCFTLLQASSPAMAWCYFGFGTTCFIVNDPVPNPTPEPNPAPVNIPAYTADTNPSNRLNPLLAFSGKNYAIALNGSDLVKDKNGDGQANALSLPRQVAISIPENATVEAAFLTYTGSLFFSDGTSVDDTDDKIGGGEAPLNSAQDAANNLIDISINNTKLVDLKPDVVGGNSASNVSWWTLQAKAGTLQDSKVGFYANRLDLTPHFRDLSGDVSVSVDRLQRADFAGNQKNLYDPMWNQAPAGVNANGQYANDCLSSASFTITVVYSLPTGPKKTVALYDGISWVWQNDFATNYWKAYNADKVNGPLSLDVDIAHEAVSASAPANIIIGTIDGDDVHHAGTTQCGSASYPHKTGHDHTWVKLGDAPTQYFQDIYEGVGAPENGESINNYSNVTSVAKGINYNVVNIIIDSPPSGATNTFLHFEGDAESSVSVEQEAFLINFVIFEAEMQ